MQIPSPKFFESICVISKCVEAFGIMSNYETFLRRVLWRGHPNLKKGKLKNLFTLRNKLAHGDWRGEGIKAALGNAVGGSPNQRAHPSVGRMKLSAGQQVIEKVIKC